MKKQLRVILAVFLLLPSLAFSWVIQKNFEDASTPVGNKVERVDGITYFQNYTQRNTIIANTGHISTKSLEMRIDKPFINGKGGLSVWANGVGFGTGDTQYEPKEGEEIWGRVYIYFSPNWSWAPQRGSMLKIMRLYPSKYYSGELILQVDPGNSGTAYTGNIMAFTQNYANGNIQLYGGTGRDASGSGIKIPIGQWFALEGYMKISANPDVAIVRVWLNGQLVLERTGNQYGYTNRQTLNRSGSQVILSSPGAVLFSTWDTDATQSGPTLPNGNQFARFDDLMVTNESALAVSRDAKGNAMIGANVIPTTSVIPVIPIIPTPSAPACTCACPCP